MGLHKVKTHKAKDTITQEERQPTKWGKSFTNYTCGRRLIFRIYKELKKNPTNKKTKHQKNKQPNYKTGFEMKQNSQKMTY